MTALYILSCISIFSVAFFIIKTSYDLFILPQLLSFFFKILAFISVLYLELNPVYIFEQERTTFFNYATLYLSLLYLLHAFGIFLYYKIYSYQSTSIEPTKFTYKFGKLNLSSALSFLPIALLFLCWFNVILSGRPPILSNAYIDRFSYIENTSLWFFLSPFGVTTSIIPVLLSFGLLSGKRSETLIHSFIFILYILYVIAIGHKFGALLQGTFLFLLPYFIILIHRQGLKSLFKKFALPALGFISISFGVIYYHYSNYSLATEFGGAFNFIIYRIFSLQGHTFWGVVNHLNILDSTTGSMALDLWEGMPNMMRLIAPASIERAIERGVNFTFGYYAAFPYFLGMFGLFLIILFGMLSSWISDLVVYSVLRGDVLEYFIIINIFNSLRNFMASGSLSSVLSIKTLILTFILIFLYNLKRIKTIRSNA